MLNKLWVEKYRPKDIEGMVLSEENRNLFTGFVEDKEIPHLILSGPAGTGKTSVAKILIDKLDAESLELNASNDRGIDVVRNEVNSFVKSRSLQPIKIVFFDEADQLTYEAQTSLRNLMETYSGSTRFIFSVNYLNRLIDPLQSRCLVVHMDETPVKERMRILLNVLKGEGLPLVPKSALQYAETFTDVRRLLFAAQKSFAAHGELRPPFLATISGDELFKLVVNKNYESAVRIAQTEGVDVSKCLTDLFWAVPVDFEKAASFRFQIAQALNEMNLTSDRVVHFLGTLSGLMDQV